MLFRTLLFVASVAGALASPLVERLNYIDCDPLSGRNSIDNSTGCSPVFIAEITKCIECLHQIPNVDPSLISDFEVPLQHCGVGPGAGHGEGGQNSAPPGVGDRATATTQVALPMASSTGAAGTGTGAAASGGAAATPAASSHAAASGGSSGAAPAAASTSKPSAGSAIGVSVASVLLVVAAAAVLVPPVADRCLCPGHTRAAGHIRSDGISALGCTSETSSAVDKCVSCLKSVPGIDSSVLSAYEQIQQLCGSSSASGAAPSGTSTETPSTSISSADPGVSPPSTTGPPTGTSAGSGGAQTIATGPIFGITPGLGGTSAGTGATVTVTAKSTGARAQVTMAAVAVGLILSFVVVPR
ncbi:uncharacterized protein LOC62_02G002654 [Vanrija pseudolonga]|uniref:Extracellular membrane protein CFEM domain-containing protein n=1 Tax=Vanrija pseudolonga TaxID=143232 RepID=A0AAF0Y8Y2_9TREE|nr:hypothetical protein LOC62_02G002654 [Vanrija pseudolonga]